MSFRDIVSGLLTWTVAATASPRQASKTQQQDDSAELDAAGLEMTNADEDTVDVRTTGQLPAVSKLLVSELEDAIVTSHALLTTIDIYWRAEDKDTCPTILLWKDFPSTVLMAASSTLAELLNRAGNNMPLLLTGKTQWDIEAVLAWILTTPAGGPLSEMPMVKRTALYRSHTLHRTALALDIIPLADIARKRVETILADQAGSDDVKLAYTYEPARFLRQQIVKSIGEAVWAGRIRGRPAYRALGEELPECQRDMCAWWEERRRMIGTVEAGREMCLRGGKSGVD